MNVTRKLFIWVLITVVLTLGGGELFARYYFGLGTPPLYVADPKIEYMFKPDQDIYRFGNHIVINHYGMRSVPFASHSTKNELRLMAFGDSVLNGGSQTDHAELATTVLQGRLASITNSKVVVGNISAGSWGPGNWLAYANEYGFFDADVVILVISSHDYADNPTFESLNPNTYPTEKPLSALAEGISRYLPRYLPLFASSENTNESNHFAKHAAEEETKGLADLSIFLALARNSSKQILVFQHWTKEEIEKSEADPGNERIREICESIGISPIQLMPYFLQSMQSGANPYRDNIHANQTGQQLIAEAVLENLPNDILLPSHLKPLISHGEIMAGGGDRDRRATGGSPTLDGQEALCIDRQHHSG